MYFFVCSKLKTFKLIFIFPNRYLIVLVSYLEIISLIFFILIRIVGHSRIKQMRKELGRKT